jgi:hypothetical protein
MLFGSGPRVALANPKSNLLINLVHKSAVHLTLIGDRCLNPEAKARVTPTPLPPRSVDCRASVLGGRAPPDHSWGLPPPRVQDPLVLFSP